MHARSFAKSAGRAKRAESEKYIEARVFHDLPPASVRFPFLLSSVSLTASRPRLLLCIAYAPATLSELRTTSSSISTNNTKGSA